MKTGIHGAHHDVLSKEVARSGLVSPKLLTLACAAFIFTFLMMGIWEMGLEKQDLSLQEFVSCDGSDCFGVEG